MINSGKLSDFLSSTHLAEAGMLNKKFCLIYYYFFAVEMPHLDFSGDWKRYCFKRRENKNERSIFDSLLSSAITYCWAVF